MPNPIVHEWMRLREAFAVYNPCESVCNQGGRDRRESLRARHRAGVIEPVESTMKSGSFLTGSGFGVTGCGLCGLDSRSLIHFSMFRAFLISA